MNRTLFLAWQDTGPSRAWFPVGRLDADVQANKFTFEYVCGAKRAQQEAGFEPLISFPELSEKYESFELFPLFRNRVLTDRREDFADYLKWLNLPTESAAPPVEIWLQILERTGGTRQTDHLEVFPKIEKSADGSFQCISFVHGLRYMPEASRERADKLIEGEELRIALELSNPVTGRAVTLLTHDNHVVGWAPRYLAEDLEEALKGTSRPRATVDRVNRGHLIPMSSKVLVRFHGNFDSNYRPMESIQFQRLSTISH